MSISAGNMRSPRQSLCADRAAALPLDQLWLGSVASLADICTQLGDRTSAAILYELMLPYAQRNIIVGVPIGFGAAATYLGRLAAMLGHVATAARHFEAALALNAKLGAPPFVAHAAYHYALLLLRNGQPSDQQQAADLLEQARATAEAFGMQRLSEQIAALPSDVERRALSRRYPNNLTEREVAVLRLIAAGKTTKEIAALLIISPPTVERHITHLYGKIGARSRADATAYALRHGLT
jgi:DNA-binding NarL/FixJ family response regulator